jgi:hypothetical protein
MEQWNQFRHTVAFHESRIKTKQTPPLFPSRWNAWNGFVLATIIITLILLLILVVLVAAPFVSLSGDYKNELLAQQRRVDVLKQQLQELQSSRLQQQVVENPEEKDMLLLVDQNDKDQKSHRDPPVCIDKKMFIVRWWQKRLNIFTPSQQQQNTQNLQNAQNSQAPQKTPEKVENEDESFKYVKHLRTKDLLGILRYHAPFPETTKLTDDLAKRMFQDFKNLVKYLEIRKTKDKNNKNNKNVEVDLLPLLDETHGLRVLDMYLKEKKCWFTTKCRIKLWMNSYKNKLSM